MDRFERLISEIKKQLFPYSIKRDVDMSCARWEVSDSDCLGSWIAQQLRSCCQKNLCARRGSCAQYAQGDIAKRNYEICREILLLFENGEIACSRLDKTDTK